MIFLLERREGRKTGKKEGKKERKGRRKERRQVLDVWIVSLYPNLM